MIFFWKIWSLTKIAMSFQITVKHNIFWRIIYFISKWTNGKICYTNRVIFLQIIFNFRFMNKHSAISFWFLLLESTQNSSAMNALLFYYRCLNICPILLLAPKGIFQKFFGDNDFTHITKIIIAITASLKIMPPWNHLFTPFSSNLLYLLPEFWPWSNPWTQIIVNEFLPHYIRILILSTDKCMWFKNLSFASWCSWKIRLGDEWHESCFTSFDIGNWGYV